MINAPELCKVELVRMNDLFQGFSTFFIIRVELSRIVPPNNTPSLLFRYTFVLYSRYINFYQIVYRKMSFIQT